MHQLDIYGATLPPGPQSSSTFLIRVWDGDTADWWRQDWAGVGVWQQKSFKRRLLCQIKICTEPRCNDVKSNFSLVSQWRVSQFWYRYNGSGVKLQWQCLQCSWLGSPVAFSRSPSKVSEYDEPGLSGTFSYKTKENKFYLMFIGNLLKKIW